jgi:acetyl esterase/lipase
MSRDLPRPSARRPWTVLALLIAMLGSAEGAAATDPPRLLLIPGGGFVERFDTMPYAAGGLGRARGFAVTNVRYRLNDPLAAWRQVRRLAQRARRNGRAVYAYGESAGGILAALLAERGLAEAAAVNAPPSDLTRWRLPGFPGYWAAMRNGSLSTRRLLSPALHPSTNPILVQQSSEDRIVPASMNRRWAERDPRVRMRAYAGPHVGGTDFATYVDNVSAALDYLDRHRAGRRPPP